MPVKQTIAIIGAANAEGEAVLACLLPAGHRLLLMDEAVEKLPGLQQQLLSQQPLSDTDTQPCCREACWEADVILLAKAHPTLADTLQKIRDVATNKIVVCLLQNEPQVGEQIRRYLPNSKVVFMQMNSEGGVEPVFSGDDKSAVEAVNHLFKTVNKNR